MEFYFIRHGETEANLDVSKSPILTKNGINQIKLLSNYLKNIKVDLIISSDLERAKITANKIFELNSFNPKFEFTSNLQEIYRVIVGEKFKIGTKKDRFEKDLKRAEFFYNYLLKLKLNKVFIVTHGNIIKFFIAKALNINPKNTKNIILDSSSITKFIIKNDLVEIKCINNTNHLRKEYNIKTNYID